MGFSLVEMIVVITIFGIVLGVVSRVSISMQRDYARQRAIVRAEATARNAETAITRAFVGARANPYEIATASGPRIERLSATSLRVVGDFNPADGDVVDALETITITMDQTARALKIDWGNPAGETIVASPVSDVTFAFFDGSNQPTPNNLPTGARAVLVQVTVPTDVVGTPAITRQRWIYLRNF